MYVRFFIVLCFLFSLTAHAQIRLTLFAGPQATSAHYTVSIDKIRQPTQFKYGLMAGIAMKVPFDNQLYFYPSVYYSHKGYKVTLKTPSFPPTEYAINNNTSIETVEVAAQLHYEFTKKPSHFFIRFGPAVDFAYSGREKFDTMSTSGEIASIDRKMVFSFGDYSWCSAQATLHFGYEACKGFTLFAFYEHGFGSMNNADRGPKIFHRIMGVSFGWLFGRNPYVKTKP
jgi:Outer membrane protein beta-barrel domain